MSEHAERDVVNCPGWKLTPQAWSDGKAIGFKLSGHGDHGPLPDSLQFVDGTGTVIVTWWEEARLYYRSVK